MFLKRPSKGKQAQQYIFRRVQNLKRTSGNCKYLMYLLNVQTSGCVSTQGKKSGLPVESILEAYGTSRLLYQVKTFYS